jgi:hypothetical protein
VLFSAATSPPLRRDDSVLVQDIGMECLATSA